MLKMVLKTDSGYIMQECEFDMDRFYYNVFDNTGKLIEMCSSLEEANNILDGMELV